jgi:hypothetical protein
MCRAANIGCALGELAIRAFNPTDKLEAGHERAGNRKDAQCETVQEPRMTLMRNDASA